MKSMQRRVPYSGALRCFFVYGFLLGLVGSASARTDGKDLGLHDYAEVYVDQYFPPADSLLLSENGKRKSAALAHYALGRSLEARGRMLEALDAYREVLENQPDQHFLARKTAYLLARNGSNDEALALLEKSLAENPDEPFAYISLSEYLATYRGEDDASRRRAYEVIEEALEKFPDETAVYEHLVRLYHTNHRSDEAREVLEGAVSLANADPRFWLELGKIAAQLWPPSEEDDLADRLFQNAFDQAGSDAEVIETVGDYYHSTGRFDRAISAYAGVIEQSPDRLDVREKLARVYGAKGDEEKVLSTLEEIIEIDPRSARTHKQIAQIHMRNGRFKEAIPYLRDALSITKGGSEEYNALARMMIESGEDEAAVEFLADAAYQFPEEADFPFLASFPLSRLERWDDSVVQFEKTVELAGEDRPEILDESFYFRYAAAVERGGDIDRAAKLFQKSIELIAKNDPDQENKDFVATVYNYLGYMWIENDMNIDEAGELIKTAAELDPESGAIADSLGWLYFKKGKLEEARTELLRAEEMIETPDAVIYDHIGQVYFALGDRAKAVEYLEKAVGLEPENEEFVDRLAEYEEAKASADAPPAPPVENPAPAAKSE